MIGDPTQCSRSPHVDSLKPAESIQTALLGGKRVWILWDELAVRTALHMRSRVSVQSGIYYLVIPEPKDTESALKSLLGLVRYPIAVIN